MRQENIVKIFESRGGTIVSPAEELIRKVSLLESVMFDWDGVFNPGEKYMEGSPFSEADSMGTNLLRFALWIKLSRMPQSILLSGEHNKVSFHFGQREHFSHVFYKIANKPDAIDYLESKNNFNMAACVYFFDDVLDLPVASKAGLRIMVRRKASPLFERYVIEKGLADYITYSEGGSAAVREACELIMGILGIYDELIEDRTGFSPRYQEYLRQKKSGSPVFLTHVSGDIRELDPENHKKN